MANLSLVINTSQNNNIGIARQLKFEQTNQQLARIEVARAWADGFHARYDTDDDVAVYKWTPVLPVHPHFICYLSLVYVTEINMNKQRN